MNHTANNRILALDFGRKRIGIALSDPLQIFAYPYKTFLNDHNFWGELLKLLKDMEVNKIILGFPFSETESRTSVANEILKFKSDLEKKTELEVILWDETLTSEMAKQMIISSVTKKSKRKEKGILDKNSAAIILKEYLESVKEKK
jgi:putative Holliday junction resolvase